MRSASCLQSFAQHLVVIAAQRIAGNNAGIPFRKQRQGVVLSVRQVIHARRQHAHGARHQFRRPAALAAVTRHPFHLAMPAGGQPTAQVRFRLVQLRVGYAELLESQLPRPVLDLQRQGVRIPGQSRCAGRDFARWGSHYNAGMFSISDKLYTAQACRDLDRAAIEQLSIPGFTLMSRAGNAVMEAVRAAYPASNSWLILCGAGNNGGDGYVIARLAHDFGVKTRVVALSDPDRLEGDAARAYARYRERCDAPLRWPVEIPDHINLVIDAMLGTGLDRPVEGPYRDAIQAINALDCRRVAVDIPSGLSANTGAVLGAAVHADLTVTFIGKKAGLYTADGPEQAGRILFDRLEVPTGVYRSVESSSGSAGHLLNYDYLAARLGRRARNSHKGQFGHVLVVAGDVGMSGAARLAAEGALRTGAGLVTVATHAEHAALLNLTRPEMMVKAVANQPELATAAQRATVLAVGPGLGTGAWGQALFAACVGDERPLVLDADGLNLLAAAPVTRDNWVLTPHPAEAARLLACDTRDVQADRIGCAQALASRYRAVVILKGCGSVVAAPDGCWDICALGNPGMSTGGSGDVLTGVVAAMLAQGFDAHEAARLGTLAHAAAGDRAALQGERGLLALDIARQLQQVVNA